MKDYSVLKNTDSYLLDEGLEPGAARGRQPLGTFRGVPGCWVRRAGRSPEYLVEQIAVCDNAKFIGVRTKYGQLTQAN